MKATTKGQIKGIHKALAVMGPGDTYWYHRKGCPRDPCRCAIVLIRKSEVIQ